MAPSHSSTIFVYRLRSPLRSLERAQNADLATGRPIRSVSGDSNAVLHHPSSLSAAAFRPGRHHRRGRGSRWTDHPEGARTETAVGRRFNRCATIASTRSPPPARSADPARPPTVRNRRHRECTVRPPPEESDDCRGNRVSADRTKSRSAQRGRRHPPNDAITRPRSVTRNRPRTSKSLTTVRSRYPVWWLVARPNAAARPTCRPAPAHRVQQFRARFHSEA